MSEKRIKFSTSVPESVYGELVRAARLAERSVSAEAAVRLRSTVVLRGDSPPLAGREQARVGSGGEVAASSGAVPHAGVAENSSESPVGLSAPRPASAGDLAGKLKPLPRGAQGSGRRG